MVPDKFDMVDMGGIDLIESQGVAVEGLYQRLVESITLCRYQCLYNWKFNGILIPPSYVEMVVRDGSVWINEGVNVDENDVIHIYSLVPEIIPLLAEENGVYNAPTGASGFNPVTVEVPSYTPVINPITITENGTYNVPSGVDGFNPVSVQVQAQEPVLETINVTVNGTYLPSQGVDGFSSVTVNVPSSARSFENASIFRWDFYHGSTCWGVMKKLSGSVIGQNGDNSTASIVLLGDLMQVTFHGNSQNIEVVALSSIKLTAYRTSKTLGPATSTEYTMSQNDQQSFTTDTLYGGLYLEAESV